MGVGGGGRVWGVVGGIGLGWGWGGGFCTYADVPSNRDKMNI